MRRGLTAAWLSAATLGLTAALLAWNPFETGGEILGRVFGAAPKWTQVSNLIRDPETQELSRGEQVLGSFRLLEAAWAGKPEARRVVFIGNSQMVTVSLAPGEAPPQGPEPTWVDHAVRFQPNLIAPYRLSAPGLSYTEALWYLLYLTGRPGLSPHAVMLQLNYQAFWNGGVRHGMLELLEDESFRAVIEGEADSDAAYSETFREALGHWRENRRRSSDLSSAPRMPGLVLDEYVRKKLDVWPAFRKRADLKVSFLELLYQARVYFLRLTPSTARSITGTRWLRSQASVRSIVDLCRKKGVRLILYNAPVNPAVSLYRKPEDRASFQGFITTLSAGAGVKYYDLERAVPPGMWGMWMNGPDPLHLGREGHRLLGRRVAEILTAEFGGTEQVSPHGL